MPEANAPSAMGAIAAMNHVSLGAIAAVSERAAPRDPAASPPAKNKTAHLVWAVLFFNLGLG